MFCSDVLRPYCRLMKMSPDIYIHVPVHIENAIGETLQSMASEMWSPASTHNNQHKNKLSDLQQKPESNLH